MTSRKFVLWVTGRDLLAPELPKEKDFNAIGLPAAQWELRFMPGNGLVFNLPQAPNCVFRLTQFLILGFRWRMK